MATSAYLKIYNNDGSTILFTSKAYVNTGDSGTVTSTGFTFTVNGESDIETYTYSGNKKFIGFATTKNATEPDFAIGDTIAPLGGGFCILYIVEESSPSGTTYEILYNDEVINTVEPGNKIEIHCAGDIMDYNIVVRPVASGPTMATVTITNTAKTGINAEVFKSTMLDQSFAYINADSSITLELEVGSIICIDADYETSPSYMAAWEHTSLTGDIVLSDDFVYGQGYIINGDGTITGYAYDSD